MAVTRSELISQLKSRGIRGKLSKMRKEELMDLVRKSAPPSTTPEPTGISLEADDQAGGHYFNKKGQTRSDGAHAHAVDPWPIKNPSAAAAPKKKPRKAPAKPKDPLVDPDANITVALVNKRINAGLHPGTGRKLKGNESGERFRWLLRGGGANFGPDGVTKQDLDERLLNVDEEYRRMYPNDKTDAGAVDEGNITEGPRTRQEPSRLPQPDAFVSERGEDQQAGEGSGHTYRSWMGANLQQHGGDMRAAAAAYREQRGGHFVRLDGSVSDKENGKYTKHKHRPRHNPATISDDDADATTDEDEPEPEPEPERVTRQTSPRSRRRIGRDDPRPARDDAQARSQAGPVDDGGEDGPLSGEQGGEGFMDWMRKHPFVESLADDAVGGIAVAGLGVLTGGVSDMFAGEEEEAVSGALKGASALGEDAVSALKGASALGRDAVGDAVGDAEGLARRVAARRADLVARPAPGEMRGTIMYHDLGAAETTGKTASSALSEATGNAAGDIKGALGKKADELTAEATEGFRLKAKTAAQAMGMGVIGERGNELASTYETEFEKGTPAPAPPPDPLGGMRGLQGLLGQQRMDDGPRAFGNPWYS